MSAFYAPVSDTGSTGSTAVAQDQTAGRMAGGEPASSRGCRRRGGKGKGAWVREQATPTPALADRLLPDRFPRPVRVAGPVMSNPALRQAWAEWCSFADP